MALAEYVDVLILRRPGDSSAAQLKVLREWDALPRRPRIFWNSATIPEVDPPADGLVLKESAGSPAGLRGRFPGLGLACSRHHPKDFPPPGQVDFIFYSPFAPTDSKPGITGLGVVAFAAAAQACPTPLIALGGIGESNAAEAARAGAAGIASIGAIFGADDPVAAAERLRRIFLGS